jgi:hypothetical protein
LEVEQQPYIWVGYDLEIEGYSKEEVDYHNLLLKEAGLIVLENGALGEYRPTRLTWEGHEFLDAARDTKRWEKAKGAMAQAGGFALDVMKQLLIHYLKSELGLP